MILFAIFVPGIYTGESLDPSAFEQAIGVSAGMSWVVNLRIVELWLHRRRRVRVGSGHREQHDRTHGQRRADALDRPDALPQYEPRQPDRAQG